MRVAFRQRSRGFALVVQTGPAILSSMRNTLLATLLALAPTAAPAWIAQNGLVVDASGGAEFSVPYRGKSGARDFWCAAGDYVIRELGRSSATVIYRTSSPPRRSGQGIRFSLSPESATKPGLFMLYGGPGITAGHAQGFCRDLIDIDGT